MNPTIEPPNLQPPPQPPQPHRPSTSCDRHPAENFTAFCPTCLCERLAVLDSSSSSAATSAAKKPPTAVASAALKAIFKGSSSSSSSSFLPELRRTKSFSATKNNEGLFAGVFEPQRRSCDVRVRNTLWSLFSQDDSKKEPLKSKSKSPLTSPRVSTSSVQNEENVIQNDVILEENLNINVNFSARNSNARPIEEIIEEEEEEEDSIVIEEEEEEDSIVIEAEKEEEIVVEEEGIEEGLKSMKDHIDVDSNPVKKGSSGRDLKEIAGSFWSAASVFSKKLQKWRHKQKLKKRRNGVGPTLPVEKPIGRQFRETQSEIADYGYGRRSCDTDPRFSLDAGRMSFDDPLRYSFDEPRASWDGYLIGKSFPRMPTMVSVFEDAPVGSIVSRSDAHIPVVEDAMPLPMNAINEDESVPGGSAQTRDYYSDSSSRRKSLDRSNSIRRTAAAVVAEIDELKSSASNAKVSPATVDIFHGSKVVVPEANLRDSNSNSLRDDCSESFVMGFRDNGSVVGNGERKDGKKSRRWSWNIWGFIHRRSVNKDEDDDRYSRANGVERSLSESWQELRGERNGDVRGGFNPKVLRSNSSVSWRNSQGFGGVGNGTFSSGRKSNVETNGNGRKKKEEFVLERNRSARYSPNNIDNGLLRFYLTPMRSSSRRGGWGKGKANQAHSIARSVLRLY